MERNLNELNLTLRSRLKSHIFQLRKHCAEVRLVVCVCELTQIAVILSFLPRSVLFSWVTDSICVILQESSRLTDMCCFSSVTSNDSKHNGQNLFMRFKKDLEKWVLLLNSVIFLKKLGSWTHSDPKFDRRREGFSYIDATKKKGSWTPFRRASWERTSGTAFRHRNTPALERSLNILRFSRLIL
jgi:hypothetical protein